MSELNECQNKKVHGYTSFRTKTLSSYHAVEIIEYLNMAYYQIIGKVDNASQKVFHDYSALLFNKL